MHCSRRIFCFNKSATGTRSTTMSSLEKDQSPERMPLPELTCALHLSSEHLVELVLEVMQFPAVSANAASRSPP